MRACRDGVLGGHRRVAVAVGADPRAQAQEGRDPRRPRPAVRPRGPRRPRGRAAATTPKSVSSKKVIAVRTSSSGARACGRTGAVCHSRASSSRSSRVASACSAGRAAQVLAPLEQTGAAAQGQERGAPAGLGGVGGQDRRQAQPREARVQGGLVQPPRPQVRDGLDQRVAHDAARRLALAGAQRPHALALLGQVDQLEEEGEGARHDLRVGQVGRLGRRRGHGPGPLSVAVRRATIARRVAPRPPEALGPGLLGDRVAEQATQEPDLAGQRIARHRGDLHARDRAATSGAAAFPTVCIVVLMVDPVSLPDGRTRAARAAALPAPRGSPGHHRADVGRAAGDGRRRDPRRAARRRLLALPAGPRRGQPDAGRYQRPRPLPDRPRPRALRRRRHRAAWPPRASRWSSRTSASDTRVPVGPRPRPAAVHRLDALRAALLARPGGRRAQRADRGAARLRAARRGPAGRRRRPPGRHRREGPAAGGDRGAGGRPAGHRRGAQRAGRAGDPRAAHAAGRRPRLHRPAGGGAAPWRAARRATSPAASSARPGMRAALEQVERLDRLVDSILASVRVVPDQPADVAPVDVGPRGGRDGGDAWRPSSSATTWMLDGPTAAARPGRRAAPAPDRGAPRRERRQVRAAGHHRARLVGPRGGRRARHRERRGAGHPRGVARADLRALRAPRHAHGPRLGHRPVRGQAPGRVDGRAPVVRTGRAHAGPASCWPCRPPRRI